MSRSLWARLGRLAESERRRAAERLLTDDLEGSARAAAVADAASKLLDQIHSRRERRWAVAVGTVCVLAAAFLWSAPNPSNEVSIEIDADAVVLIPRSRAFVSGTPRLNTGDVVLRNFGFVRTPVGNCSSPPGKQACKAVLTGDSVFLSELHVPVDGRITIERPDSGTIVVHSQGPEGGGVLSLQGSLKIVLAADTGVALRLRSPAWVEFGYSNALVSSRLDLPSLDSIELRQIAVRELTFVREPEPGGAVSSTILEGTVTFVNASDTVRLGHRDMLRLTGVEGQLSVVAGNPLRIRFDGRVGRVEVGPDAFSRNVAPRILETFYHSKPLNFFFSTVVVLWGLLWSARKILFPRPAGSPG